MGSDSSPNKMYLNASCAGMVKKSDSDVVPVSVSTLFRLWQERLVVAYGRRVLAWDGLNHDSRAAGAIVSYAGEIEE